MNHTFFTIFFIYHLLLGCWNIIFIANNVLGHWMQVASRMVSAFSRWRRFDVTRQNLAKVTTYHSYWFLHLIHFPHLYLLLGIALFFTPQLAVFIFCSKGSIVPFPYRSSVVIEMWCLVYRHSWRKYCPPMDYQKMCLRLPRRAWLLKFGWEPEYMCIIL